MKSKRQKPASGSKRKSQNTRQPKAAKQRDAGNDAWLDAIPPAFRANIIRLGEAYKNEFRGFVAYDQMQSDRAERYLNLEFLRHFRSLPERRRVQSLIRNIWDRRRPFCLYLRNFRFGTHYVGNLRVKIHGQKQVQTE